MILQRRKVENYSVWANIYTAFQLIRHSDIQETSKQLQAGDLRVTGRVSLSVYDPLYLLANFYLNYHRLYVITDLVFTY